MDGIVTSVGSLGKNFEASDNRSYWNNPNLYSDVAKLFADWQEFLAESQSRGNRRAMMRTIVSTNVFLKIGMRVLEAAIPFQGNVIVYLAHNEHEQISQDDNSIKINDSRDIFKTRRIGKYTLPENFSFDTKVSQIDADNLCRLWGQFGWTKEGVEKFISKHSSELCVIRESTTEKVVAAMIAEDLQFGEIKLVEVTEMAVLPEFQGRGLAKNLIQQLSTQCFRTYGKRSLVYGEFNLTTNAHRAAFSAGMIPAISDGILRDHVAIKTGEPKQDIAPWKTEFLHSYQVMYWRLPR